MAVRLKFDGVKLYDLYSCNRGSWHSRCYVTSSKSGKYFEKLHHVRDRALLTTKFGQQKPGEKARKWNRKIQSVKEATSKRAKREYGT
ncbi:hypothetical protein KUTeg_017862 [Tegillarca granosa]|uniref:Uncharacterized protein n=1 Tax=Tegillarca granosa TaxID=220873 RepID=A0ABQ9EG60_TEGGR|nr:hypothetical protein KUTeg_017862 [Tegillarca granosa]